VSDYRQIVLMDSTYSINRQDEHDFQDLLEFYVKSILTSNFSLLHVGREENF
jgi:hypothetical protein